jgi:hypothetical protein
MKKLLALTLAVLVLNLGLVATAHARTDAKKAAKVKEKITKLGIGRKARIDVKTNDGHEVVGWVSDRHEEDFVVTDDFNDVKTIRYEDVNKFVGKNLSTGQKLLIGFGVGFAAALGLIWLGMHAD